MLPSLLLCGLAVVAGAEQGRTDADPGGTFGYGRFEIVAHAPWTGCPVAGPVSVQAAGGGRRRRAARPGPPWVRGWPSARAGAGSAGSRPPPPGPAAPRGAAGLARLAADVHLQADVQRREAGRALRREAFGDLQAVHRVHPVEVLGDGLGLVRLDGADEMPGQWQVGEFLLLGQGLLQVVLAEIDDATGALRGSRSPVWSCSRPAGRWRKNHAPRLAPPHGYACEPLQYSLLSWTLPALYSPA